MIAGLFVLAGQSAGLARDYGPLPVGRGVSVPPHTEVADAPAWLGADLHAGRRRHAVHVAACSARFYLWIAAPNWPPPARPEPNLLLAVAHVAALARRRGGGARIAARRRRWRRAAGGWIGLAGARAPRRHRRSSWCMIGGVMPHPREHALGATAAALLGYVALHAGIGVLFLISNMLRIGAGFISPRRLTRPAADAAMARLHRGDGAHRNRPRARAAALVAMLGGAAVSERPVPSRQLWWLAAGFTVWCSALVVLYAMHAIGCAFAWPTGTLRLWLAVAAPRASDRARAGCGVTSPVPARISVQVRPARFCIGPSSQRSLRPLSPPSSPLARRCCSRHAYDRRNSGHRSVRFATPNARLSPIWPSIDNGCNVIVRRDPPISTLAPRPTPIATLPLAPT